MRKLLLIVLVLPMFLFATEVDELWTHLINREKLFVYGLDHQTFEKGTYGFGEISPYVRVTTINGIMNDIEDCLKTAEALSESHGGVNIHYVYWNSEGWTTDIYKGFFSKVFGYLSVPAMELANLWRRLIEEMGGEGSPGIIYHYAHSIGATETTLASSLLTDWEKKKLHIVTFGPATIISPEGFGSAVNYISWRDAVSVLDPWNFYLARSGALPYAFCVGEFDSIYPILEHTLLTGTYFALLQEHGIRFIERYSQFQISDPTELIEELVGFED